MTTHRATVDQQEHTQGVRVLPLAGHTGAEITGVDLAGPLDDAVAALIRRVLLRWKVMFFRGSAWTTPAR